MHKKTAWLASASLLIALGAQGAWAQTAAADTATGADEGEIVVTATRRAQALSDVPIAVSAVTAESLQNSGASDIRQLNQLAPSLLVSSATNESSGVARIRGIGTVGENPGLESSVAVFIDGVYRSRTGVGLGELGQVDRIEVLRGPQGTLFGRNASAGLLNIVTAKPQFEFGGSAAATYGNYDFMRFEGSVTGPIAGDKAAARIDGVYVKRDGFLKDVVSGRGLNDRDRYIVRGQIQLEPNDDLSIRIIGDYSKKQEECCGAAYLPSTVTYRRDAQGNVTTEPNQLFNIIQALGGQIQIPTAKDGQYVYRTSITPGFDYHQDSSDMGVSAEANWKLGDINLTSITAYREYKSENGQDSDFNALDILRRTDQDRKFETFTQELRFQGSALGDRLDWLVGGYYAHETLTVDDDIKYGNDYERYANCVLAENFSRAIGSTTLFSTTGPGCFNTAVATAVATNPALPAAVRTPVGLLSGLAIPGVTGFRAVATAIGFPLTGNFLNGTGVVNNQFEQTSRNYALFTHNVFSVVPDKLDLTAGVRYTNERKTLDGTFNTNNAFCTALRASSLQSLQGLPCVINSTSGTGLSLTDPGRVKTESEWSGTAVLSYKVTPDVLTYVSYSKGYKAGGFNLDTSALDPACSTTFDTGNPAVGLPSCAARLASAANQPGNGRAEIADLRFEPEKVDAYEIGLKWNGRGIDINVAAFYQAFQNFQLNTFNGVNFEVTNIASCKDDLAGGDRDANFTTGACAAGRTRAGVISKGLEFEAFAQPTPTLSTTLGVTYTDTSYRKNLTGTAGRALSPALFQLPGHRLSNSSAYTVTGSAAWTPDVTDTVRGLVYVDFRYQSELNTGSDLDIEKDQPGFFTMNARIGVNDADKKWGVELWAQNLLNTKYQQIAADAPLQGGGTFRSLQAGLTGVTSANPLYIAFPAEPRTYGVTVRTRF